MSISFPPPGASPRVPRRGVAAADAANGVAARSGESTPFGEMSLELTPSVTPRPRKIVDGVADISLVEASASTEVLFKNLKRLTRNNGTTQLQYLTVNKQLETLEEKNDDNLSKLSVNQGSTISTELLQLTTTTTTETTTTTTAATTTAATTRILKASLHHAVNPTSFPSPLMARHRFFLSDNNKTDPTKTAQTEIKLTRTHQPRNSTNDSLLFPENNILTLPQSNACDENESATDKLTTYKDDEEGLSRMDRLTLLLTRGRGANVDAEHDATSGFPALSKLTKHELDPSCLK